MACFVVPGAEAVVLTVVQKILERQEAKAGGPNTEHSGLSWSRKLSWLNKLLWGGTILLALEHIWHGEVVPWPPFLTAMENPANVAPMLHEIATVGVAMAVAVTIVWGIIVLIADRKARVSLEIKATSAEGVK
jgi:hypothetical protein